MRSQTRSPLGGQNKMQRPYSFASAFLCVVILAACGGDNSGLS